MVSAAIIRLSQAKDQKKAILEAAGDLSKIEPLQNMVLVAAYIEPEKIGSIITTTKRKDESVFQGTVGLVLKIGPTAFRYNGQFTWEGPAPKVGDWVVHRNSDAWRVQINAEGRPGHGVECRMIADGLIKAVVTDPTYVY